MKALALLVMVAFVSDDPRFLSAVAAYNDFRFEQAALEFQSLAIDANSYEPPDRALVFVWLGLARAGLGDFEPAAKRFEDALVLVPELELPVEASPKVSSSAIRPPSNAATLFSSSDFVIRNRSSVGSCNV